MAQGILINDFRPVYSENILPSFSDFETTDVINKTSGSVTSDAIFTTLKNYSGNKCIMSYNDDILTPLVFNFGSNLTKTITKTGNYIFSLQLQHIATTVFNDVLKVNVYIDGILTNIIENELVNNDIGIEKNNWHCFAQSFILSAGQVIDFTFEHICDPSGFGFSTIYFDALKLEYDDRYLGTPSIYSRPLEQITENATGYQSRTDTINTQVLTGLTDNLVSFTGVLEENGGLTLMDSNCKITPIQQGDVLVLDFAFDCVAPIGSDNFLVISLKVDGVVYRNINMPIVKGAGLVDNFSVSWSLPIGASFLANGGEVYINPNTAITISNRYMVVSRTHKAV